MDMKNSGIGWIGLIPKCWKIRKLKFILCERNEKNNPIITNNILSLTAAQGVIPYSEKEGGGNKPKEDLTAYKIARPNDVVMNSMNVLSGSVGLSKYLGCVSPVYYMFYSDNLDINIEYYNFIFQTTVFQKSLMGLGNGILIKESENGKLNTIRMRIPVDKLNNIFFPNPNRYTQDKIVDFLNDKVEKINGIIADTKYTLKLYKEYKQSIITEAVTKGLNSNVEMKESGIKWIGMIPKQWGIIRGKYILKYLQKPVKTSDDIITCFRDGVVTLRSNRREDGFTFAEKEIGYQGVDIGDLVVHGMDGFAGAIGISDSRGKASPVLNVLDSNNNKKYLMYYLRSMAYSDVFLATATGIRVRSCDLRWNKLSQLSYPIPTKNEQDEIVSYLEKKCALIDKLIMEKRDLIDKLEEYKKSLIYEYVTGKKEV